jgi:hypothetical protein
MWFTGKRDSVVGSGASLTGVRNRANVAHFSDSQSRQKLRAKSPPNRADRTAHASAANALQLTANLFGHRVGVAVAGDVIAIESPKFDKSRCGNAYVQETGSRRRANHFFQLSYNPETVDWHRNARSMNSL